MRLQLSISPKFALQSAVFLLLVVVGLAMLSLASEVVVNSSLFSSLLRDDGQIGVFALDEEGNIPTWYSSSILLICAGLLAIISIASRGSVYRLQWAVLSLVFLYLSADEAIMIHEKVNLAVGVLFPLDEFLPYAWIIVYAPLVLIFGLAYLKFVRDLSSETKRLFVVAGVLYVTGALGMEAIGGAYATLYGGSDVVYSLITHFEETLEMLGVVVFFYALLLYISFHVREINVGSKI